MEFGKTPFFKDVKFELASDQVLFEHSDQEQPQIFLGTPGWNQKEWIKRIYPEKCPANEFLYHYSRRVNTIELNSTHYAMPAPDKIARWRDLTPSGFRFCPKVPQRISHHGLIKAKNEWNYFIDSAMTFEDRLGPCFLQLPDYFDISDFSLLQDLIEATPPSLSLAIEFRNPSFYRNQNLKKNIGEYLLKKNIGAVITDTAGRRDIVHATLPNSTVLVRFIGNYHEETDHDRLGDWLEKIDSWFQQGLKNLYFFTHQPDNIHSIDLADYMARQFNSRLQTALKLPLECEEELRKGPQGSLFD